MKGDIYMGRIYDRHDEYVGYFRDNRIYNKRNELIGYMENNVAYDINSSPVLYFYDDKFYWMNGMPWAYFNGRAIRDLNGNYIGSAANTLPSLIAAGLIFSNKILEAQYKAMQHTNKTNSNRGYIPNNNPIGVNGLGGMVQSVMNIGRSMFGGGNTNAANVTKNSSMGEIGPLVSIWGKYLLANPKLTMSILSRFIKL
ncbi:5-fold beta-flower protein [Clostridium oryzae]